MAFFAPTSASCSSCTSSSSASEDCHQVHVGDTCPDMIVEVQDEDGQPADLREWGASAQVFYRAKLTAEALLEDLVWYMSPGPDKTKPAIGDIITVEDCYEESVTVTGLSSCYVPVILRTDSSGDDHAAGANLRVLRGTATARVLVTTSAVGDLTYELSGSAYTGDKHQADDGTWWTGAVQDISSEQLTVVGTEKITSSRVVVTMNELITTYPGTFAVRVILAGPDGQRSTLPRSSDGFCLKISA